ncbi:soluble inorganic pyrophosphatase 2 [Anaeramoeba ignava]|uniref:inorganic diphosphatase n=1 Tax=Anaeramoeba ignava TaxID=1746090 RepID=A0A9Q0LW73_ANAIG|nr:soluble inorganic pyrophosphatase 2 [Anaeramoeba ignava]
MKKQKFVKHPWHFISLGTNPPNSVNAVIETPIGSRFKSEINKSGALSVCRFLVSYVYPANYGFIPQTLGLNHKPLKILVLMQAPVVPLTFLSVRPIGCLPTVDGGYSDDKIIAIYEHDPEYAQIKSINELPFHLLLGIMKFFDSYKNYEDTEVKVLKPEDSTYAFKLIEEGHERYKRIYADIMEKSQKEHQEYQEFMKKKNKLMNISFSLNENQNENQKSNLFENKENISNLDQIENQENKEFLNLLSGFQSNQEKKEIQEIQIIDEKKENEENQDNQQK